jgi:chromosome partitioning protein
MSVISIAIQKGGCGKTTTTINLAAALQQLGKKILLIDADPQSSLTEALGISDHRERNLSTELYREIKGEGSDLQEAIVQTRSGLDLVPSSIELASAELELISVYGREQVFNWMLEKIIPQYDYIFIDCPPSVGMLTVNALIASESLIMPVQAEFLPIQALNSFMQHLKALKKLNKKLDILGIVMTRYDNRRILDREAYRQMENDFGEKLFHTAIRNNCRIANAQKAGLYIFNFDKRSHGAEDYYSLALEFLEKIGDNITITRSDQKMTEHPDMINH